MCDKHRDKPNSIGEMFIIGDVEGKDVIVIDDMISSGESVLEVAAELKLRKANRIFIFATFGLFTNDTYFVE